MKKLVLFFIFGGALSSAFTAKAQVSVTVFDEILFYDGYAGVVNFPVPDGVIRHRNDLYAKKLSAEQLAAFGNTMDINVTIKASCDNYDRIGNVNLAFVPIGAATYDPAMVQRIELGRFITPFMNKNVEPSQVPYTFSVDNVAKIFKDPAILAAYDIWAELEVFGVPYAAQTQVAGCAGRNDVFFGTLEFVSNGEVASGENNYLLPLNFKKDLNNYQVGATDVIGTTARTINFTLPAALNDAKLYLITSNHGANAGGEEYNRRFHHVYFDGPHVLIYKPGSLTCEPFRAFNTQGNGIYGPTPRTDAEWQSFSNWCPGDVIPIRVINLGNLTAGNHEVKLTVPSAVFVDQQGYIPVSLYLQGSIDPLAVENFTAFDYSLYPNPTESLVKIQSVSAVKSFTVFNLLGQSVTRGNTNQIDLSDLGKGVYLVEIDFENAERVIQKVIKK